MVFNLNSLMFSLRVVLTAADDDLLFWFCVSIEQKEQQQDKITQPLGPYNSVKAFRNMKYLSYYTHT